MSMYAGSQAQDGRQGALSDFGIVAGLESVVRQHKASRNFLVSAYGATKHAVRGLAQQVAAEYAANGIRANSISPGSAHLFDEAHGLN